MRCLTGYAGVFTRRHRRCACGHGFDWLLHRIAAKASLAPAALLTPSKVPARLQHRSLLWYWAVRELGLPGTVLAAKLGLAHPAVSRTVIRGERLAREKGAAFPKRIKS